MRPAFALRLLLSVIPVTMAFGQEPGLADSLRSGGAELRQGHLERAKDLFRWALRADKSSVPARIGLGRVAIAENAWGDGCDWFEEAMERDTGSMAARYYEGICRREYGAQVAWLLRKKQWGKAMDDFLWVIARDSSYEDVLYQLALLYRYKEEYDLALDLGRVQVDRRPDLYSAALGLFRLYRYVVAVVPAGEILRLLSRRHDPFALYFAGEALRKHGKEDDAEKLFASLLVQDRGIPVQAVRLSLARIRFAKGDDAGGEAFYWQAVDDIRSWLGSAVLFEDIKYIVTDGELAAYDAISSDRKKAAFYHLFWNIRNPSPAARTNVRLAEHERRILRAEREFEFYGFRTHFNDPDKLHFLRFPRAFRLNAEFNDKGLVYIRHGQPSDISRTIGEELNECWLYNATEESPRRIFYFTQSNSTGNNWRLTSFPEDPQMWEYLVMWDQRYNRVVNGNALDQAQLQDQLRAESGDMVEAGLSTDEHTWKKETRLFSFPHSIDAFRADGGKTLVNVSYAVPVGEIARQLPDTTQTLRVEVGISISRANGELMASNLDTLALPVRPGAPAAFVELFRFALRPDSVRIAMLARPLGLDMVSAWDRRVRIPEYPAALPMLSDVEFLLPSSAKSSIDINGMKVVASPFQTAPLGQPLYVYWQVYNLTRDADGKTAYRSRVLLTPGDTGPGEGSIVAYDRDHTGQEESAAELAQIDLRSFRTGNYVLTVEVTDRKMVRTFLQSRGVELTGD